LGVWRERLEGGGRASCPRQANGSYRSYALKWDGEWQITYETVRDMGIAYAAGLVLIYLQVDNGVRLARAIVDAAAAGAKPIALTGLAAMLGALFILDDPIFNGFAISFVFGILVATLLTLVVIPVLYFAVNRHA